VVSAVVVVGYDILHLCRVFVVEVGEVLTCECVLCVGNYIPTTTTAETTDASNVRRQRYDFLRWFRPGWVGD